MNDLARRHGLDLAASWAYSDSVTDLPSTCAEAVGHPVAANPDRALAPGWPRSAAGGGAGDFTLAVPLRGRTPGPVQAAAGGVAVAAAAGLTWWLLHRSRPSAARPREGADGISGGRPEGRPPGSGSDRVDLLGSNSTRGAISTTRMRELLLDAAKCRTPPLLAAVGPPAGGAGCFSAIGAVRMLG